MTHTMVAAIAERLRARGQRLACAESCTGGLLAAACTEVAGSSDWFERGWVTYSNAAKSECLGVAAALIAEHGAVSEAVARAMALGALAASSADWALATTGIAGPGGAVPGKPLGTVWRAVAWRDSAGLVHSAAELRVWPGGRAAVRAASVQWVLNDLLARLR